jgi:hypothetical protein
VTYILAALVVILTLGYLPAGWLVLRYLRERDQSDRLERAALEATHQSVVRDLLAQAAGDRDEHRKQIAGLCQRIQAPEVAVIQHQAETAGPGEAIYPLTDEQSAEQQNALQAAIAEIERIEAEGVLP